MLPINLAASREGCYTIQSSICIFRKGDVRGVNSAIKGHHLLKGIRKRLETPPPPPRGNGTAYKLDVGLIHTWRANAVAITSELQDVFQKGHVNATCDSFLGVFVPCVHERALAWKSR